MSIAYIDESQMAGTGSGGAYFLGATIVVDFAEMPEMRDTLVRLKPKTQKKLHWYDAVETVRSRTISAVASFDLDHVVVEHRVLSGETSERSRRACIEVMMYELRGFAVDHVVFESRGPADDKRDMKMLDAMRAKKRVQGIRFDHVLGTSEPLLWVPDAVLGATESARLGEPRYLRLVESQVLILPTA